MEKVTIFYSLHNNGDGSVRIKWHLSHKTAQRVEEAQDEGWGEDCTGSAETFVGSDIYKKAESNCKLYCTEDCSCDGKEKR